MHELHKQVSFFCGKSAAERQTDDKFLLDINIKLIITVSALVMLFQIINLFEPHTYVYPYVSMGSFIMAAASVLHLSVVFFLLFNNRARYILISNFVYIFILSICLTPFVILDANTTRTPINIVLFYFLMAIGPVFSQKENMITVSIASFWHLAVVLLCGAKPLFCVVIAAGTLTVLLKSNFLNIHYIRTLSRLQAERDTDALTGILNRRSGIESAITALTDCIRHNKTCSVLVVDIDFFKSYNDCYGHVRGDEVLRIIAGCITEQFNKKGNIVYRMGGEEFVIFAETSGSDEIIAEAKELQRRIAKTETDFTRSAPLPTVSIGIMLYRPGTGYTGEPLDLISLISGADGQLYHAKKSGRNMISHDNIIYS